MIRIKNEIFVGHSNRESLVDITIPENFNKKVVFFVHGYKGYKDWGAWNDIEKEFVLNGFAFVKFNLSHNGGTTENPIDFPDLDAFSENNYSKEIYDIAAVIKNFRLNFSQIYEESEIYLIGHSRGGADVILFTAENKDIVDGLVTWASISDIEDRFPKGEELEKWKREGVRYVLNGRTKQEMPHKISFYEDFVENKERLNIKTAAGNIDCPWLVIHGDQDEAVSLENAHELVSWSCAELFVIPNTGHTFGASHPFESTELPDATKSLVEKTMDFFNKC